MKTARTIPIALSVIALVIVWVIVDRVIFDSGGKQNGGDINTSSWNSARGLVYGNLWIMYWTEGHSGTSSRPRGLIATPEYPEKQSSGGVQYTVGFASGDTFTVRNDTGNIVWIDPRLGPSTLPAELTLELLQRIEETGERAQGQCFESGADFLKWLDNTTKEAEQPGTGQPATRPVVEPEGGDNPQPEAEGRSR